MIDVLNVRVYILLQKDASSKVDIEKAAYKRPNISDFQTETRSL